MRPLLLAAVGRATQVPSLEPYARSFLPPGTASGGKGKVGAPADWKVDRGHACEGGVHMLGRWCGELGGCFGCAWV